MNIFKTQIKINSSLRHFSRIKNRVFNKLQNINLIHRQGYLRNINKSKGKIVPLQLISKKKMIA